MCRPPLCAHCCGNPFGGRGAYPPGLFGAAGAPLGYFGGKVDLLLQRAIEIWGALPELYLLIIFASIFEPSLPLLLILLFCLPELPRIEFPPLPRPLAAPSWRDRGA